MIPATLLKKGGPSGTAYSLLAVVEIGNSTLPTLLACWSCEMLLKMVLGPVGANFDKHAIVLFTKAAAVEAYRLGVNHRRDNGTPHHYLEECGESSRGNDKILNWLASETPGGARGKWPPMKREQKVAHCLIILAYLGFSYY